MPCGLQPTRSGHTLHTVAHPVHAVACTVKLTSLPRTYPPAVPQGNVASAELLLDAGAAVDECGALDGTTPLWIAAHEARESIVRLLLAHSASVNQPSVSGCTPLVAAARSGAGTIARLLVENGAPVEESVQWARANAAYGADEGGCITLLEEIAKP